MNLRQLELFVAIAETGSFSRGAEAVSLTQSTVSQHISALEDEVGTHLFDRTGRGVILTSGGELFLSHARRILAERDALQQSMAGFKGLESARLSVGASNIPANYLLPPLLPQLNKDYPGIALTMMTGDTSEVIKALLEAEIELALVGSRITNDAIAFEPLMNDSLVLIVGDDHRWSRLGMVSVAELLDEPLIVREAGSGSGQSLDNALRKAGHDPAEVNVAACLGSNEAVIQTVANGYGCAFVSEVSVRSRIARKELYKIDVDGLIVERQIWLAKLKSRTLSPAAEVFTSLLCNSFRS